MSHGYGIKCMECGGIIPVKETDRTGLQSENLLLVLRPHVCQAIDPDTQPVSKCAGCGIILNGIQAAIDEIQAEFDRISNPQTHPRDNGYSNADVAGRRIALHFAIETIKRKVGI